MLIPGALTSLRGERGFTLIETLVAMVTGVIVTGALFSVLEVSTRQSSRISDVAQATQLGRTTLTRVLDEMHSACISTGFKPVQVGSTPAKLILEDGYSEGAEVPAVGTTTTGVRKDTIEWNEATGTLIDYTNLGASETTPGVYTFSASRSPSGGVRIGEHVTRTTEGSEKAPIFTYYKYAEEAQTETTKSSNTLEEIKTSTLTKEELTAPLAEKVGAVEVKFTIAPTDNNVKLGRSAEFGSLSTFAFSAPDSEKPITNGPCE